MTEIALDARQRQAVAAAFLEWVAKKEFVLCRPTPTGAQLYEPVPFRLQELAQEWVDDDVDDPFEWKLDITRSHVELRHPDGETLWRVPRSSKERVAEIDALLKSAGYRDGLGASGHVSGLTARRWLIGKMDEMPAGTKRAKRGDFAIGRRWRCTRRNRHSFDFVIVAAGSKPDTKRCRVEVLDEKRRDRPGSGHGIEQEYSHRHIKRCAKLVEV